MTSILACENGRLQCWISHFQCRVFEKSARKAARAARRIAPHPQTPSFLLADRPLAARFTALSRWSFSCPGFLLLCEKKRSSVAIPFRRWLYRVENFVANNLRLLRVEQTQSRDVTSLKVRCMLCKDIFDTSSCILESCVCKRLTVETSNTLLDTLWDLETWPF